MGKKEESRGINTRTGTVWTFVRICVSWTPGNFFHFFLKWILHLSSFKLDKLLVDYDYRCLLKIWNSTVDLLKVLQADLSFRLYLFFIFVSCIC